MKRGKQKAMTILMASVAIIVLAMLIEHLSSLGYREKVIFSSGNKIYTAQLNKPGKKLVAEIEGVNRIEIEDTLNNGQSILLISKDEYKNELIIYSQGVAKIAYKVSHKKYDWPIFSATFGKDTNEILFTLVESGANGQVIELYKLDVLANKVTKLSDLQKLSNLHYSRELDALLIDTSEVINEGQDDAHLVFFVGLYDMSEGRVSKLVRGSDAVWLEDGKKFLFRGYGIPKRLYEYDMTSGKVTKEVNLKASVMSVYLSSSPDNDYVLGQVAYDIAGMHKSFLEIISLKNGRQRKIIWAKYQLNPFGEPPWDMRVVK